MIIGTRIIHGKRSTYNRFSCRCSKCTEAQRVYQLRYKREKRNIRVIVDGELTTTADVPHGLASTYNNYSCRCIPCRNAYSEYKKRFV